jgi:hypothetical protein
LFAHSPSLPPEGTSSEELRMTRAASDEAYVVDLCDKILGLKSKRQHRFDFLLGDSNSAGRQAKLPVDAYYEELGLVIEYWERQHQNPTPFWDRRMTPSGCTRGEQRRIYDERRREVLRARGIGLVVLTFEQLDHAANGKLRRNNSVDEKAIRAALSVL